MFIRSSVFIMDYVLFGIQGAGKGTQGKILAEKIGAAYFETGGELRRLSHENSELGEKVKTIIEAGHLVPNGVVMEIVENFIQIAIQENKNKPIIFDGIPRNKEQNDSFRALLKKTGREYIGIYFELTREQAEERLLKRRVCAKCKSVYPAFYAKDVCEKCGEKLVIRADDNENSIRTRIDIFYKETLPIIEEWRRAEKIISVNGVGKIKNVTKGLLEQLKM